MQNPFSTVATLPGKLEFICPAGSTIDSLLDSYSAHKYQAQIVGPHGSGKSTLVRNLSLRLEDEFEVINLDPRELNASNETPVLRVSRQRCLLVIDGIEQVSSTLTCKLLDWVRENEIPILCTCHDPVDRLPVLLTTHSNPETFHQLVTCLLNDSPCQPGDKEIRSIFERHQGNVREAFFELYDWFELQKSK